MKLSDIRKHDWRNVIVWIRLGESQQRHPLQYEARVLDWGKARVLTIPVHASEHSRPKWVMPDACEVLRFEQ